jgi:Insertion element 4 transposase N-terminal
VSSCLRSAAAAIRSEKPAGAGTPAGTLVVRAADLGFHGSGTVTAAGTVPRSGEEAVFFRPVVSAPAVVRRDGTVLADAWLPGLARLGELEAYLGDGVIEDAVAGAIAAGLIRQRQRQRLMSHPFTIRGMIAMGLMPDASYCQALSRLAGLLADVPLAREWHVPTEKVMTAWRNLVPPSVMEALFWKAAGPLIADDEPSAVMLAGMPVCAADGMLVNVADTPANRKFFGTTGTADGSSPFPQLRIVALTARAGRSMLGAVTGQAHAGEQTLLKRLVKRRPDLFTGRITCFDRNFPGHDLILAIVQAGGHVIARVKAGIALPLADGGGWLPDGSRVTWLNAPSGRVADRLPVRAAEHNATLPGSGASETCTLITTFLDHQAAPADGLRGTYLHRWSASETTFGEDKSTIAGTGNRTSGPVLRSGVPRMAIQEAWAWLTGTQLVRASQAATLRGEHAAARALHRREQQPVTADEESFTAARHHAIRSMTSSQVTATSSLAAIAAAAGSAARAHLHTLNAPGRQRHSPRTQKARPKFPHAAGTKATVTGTPKITIFAPGRY